MTGPSGAEQDTGGPVGPYGGRVLRRLVTYRWALEPALGVLLLVCWLLFGSVADAQGASVVSFFCGALALSRVAPGVALGLTWCAAFIALVGPHELGSTFGWMAYIAVLLTLFGVAAHGRRAVLWLALASAPLLGFAGAFVLDTQNTLAFPHFGPSFGGLYASYGIALLLMWLVLTTGLCAGWLLGFLVARQRGSPQTAGASVLVWLAQSGGAAVDGSGQDSGMLVRRLSPRQLIADVSIAGAFALGCAITGVSPRPWILVTVGFTIAVALRRISPAVALAVAWFAAIVQMTSGLGVQFSDVGVLIVLYATAAYGDRIVRWSGLVSAGVGAVVAALYLSVSSALDSGYFNLVSSRIAALALQFAFLFVVSATVLGLSWVLGLLMRTWRTAIASRRAQAEAEVERLRAQEDVVVEQERTRIARDMHDVVAHSLAVVIAQADGARYARATDPDAVDEALTTIASTAREALGDVRLLLGELRHAESEGPQPSLADLDRLVDQLRAAGLPIELSREGADIALGSAHQIAAYRIVQEALTNALRHGDTTRTATVDLDGEPNGVTITVTNALKDQPAPDGSAQRVGHGLPGMRERAVLSGGWLTAEPHGDRFVVRAFLPVPAAVRQGGGA
ncbi:sensor histidine kinase [Diaminobutyricibacter tongyongensis]|uniref:histidine kinase n=1 Tax=Leifsonia tongyongensis TaxID=1268043 RepID=A0A6L9XYG6_9MICO|nr:sensor histidine kinase [Diaminobutyricibacter tongyongensis]NEN06482.1 sensor histidine kinase [Diaminobutyricibacter tongyongensis]